MKKIAAKSIVTEWGELSASMDDKLTTGENINSGSIAMGSEAGKLTIMHEGKKHELIILHDMGASICILGNNRRFRLNLERLVDYAIESGLLKSDLVFEPEYQKK